MKKPLYADYILERENSHYYETDYGFVTYREEDNHIYLVDMYIKPEYRKKGNGREFVKYMENIAKEWGKNLLITSASLEAKGAETSVKAILACGFKFYSINKNDSMLYFSKGVL